MTRTISVILVLLLPGFTLAASPLQLECAAAQSLPGRALVCEYFMLDRLNARLAELHEAVVHAGKAGRVEVKRWLAARDACQDVECLDRLFEAGIREAKIALVDVESREPTRILPSARGVPIRVAENVPSLQETPIRERAGRGVYVALLVLAGVVLYALVARRLTA